MTERDWNKDWEMCEKASPPPWRFVKQEPSGYGIVDAEGKFIVYEERYFRSPEDEEKFTANLVLMAEASEALPYWLQRVQELEKEVERLTVGYSRSVANVLGKPSQELEKECSYCIDEPPEDCPPELRAIAKQIICRRVPDFSTDIAAAWEIEEELKKRGLAGKYTESLWNEVGEIYHGKDFGEFVFAIIHATPLQRCRAALKAVTW